jgi:hypothetical protein
MTTYVVHQNSFYAFNMEGLAKDFMQKPLGHQAEVLKCVKAFKSRAKEQHILCKRQTYRQAIAEFVKNHKPTAMFCQTQAESSTHKNDSIVVYWI